MRTWAEIDEAVTSAAADFDASRLGVGDAAALLPVLVRVKNAVAAVEAMVAARLAETDRWRLAGAKEPAEDLARRSGVSVGQARAALETGRALAGFPELRAAALGGALSAGQAALIADAASVAPDAVPGLVAQASTQSTRELRDAAHRAKAAADPDPEATRRRIHDARGLWSRREGDGSQVLTWRDNPERITLGLAALAPIREELFRAARRAGRRERPEVLDADALHLLLTGGSARPVEAAGAAEVARAVEAIDAAEGTGSDRLARRVGGRRSGGRWSAAKILVRIDASAAQRGRPVAGEVCEIAGSGPVAVSAVTEMLREGAALAVVETVAGRRAGTQTETQSGRQTETQTGRQTGRQAGWQPAAAPVAGVETGTVIAVTHVPRPRAAAVELRDPGELAELSARHRRPVAGIVHPGRKPTSAQTSALQWISPTCSALGCANLRCEVDHRTGWAITRTTRLEDLDRLCGFHHDLKTRAGWRLAAGDGRRAFLPPPVHRPPPATRATARAP